MPELPEVETIVGRIKPHLLGKRLQKIHIRHPKSVQGNPKLVESSAISAVYRRAKMLVFAFENDNAILIHLKMTGQILYQDTTIRLGGGHPTADWVSDLPSKHTRAILEFSDESKVFFNDMRLFGWIKVVSQVGLQEELQKYAPDVIASAVTPKYFFDKLQRRRQAIKVVVMDQALVAGVGNIYANDALHLAKIHPMCLANALSMAEATKVLRALQTVIHLGIEKQGATIHSFRYIDGFAGSYQDVLRVYGRDGLPCSVCKTTIIRSKIGGRGTFFCPNCQPEVGG